MSKSKKIPQLFFEYQIKKLQEYIREKNFEGAKALLKEDKDMLANTPNVGPQCPLVLAIKSGDLAIVKLLLKYEAYVNSNNTIITPGKWGFSYQSCLALAYEKREFLIAEILIENGAMLLQEEMKKYGEYYCCNMEIIVSRRLEMAQQAFVQQALDLAAIEAHSN